MHQYFASDALSPVQEKRLWKELSEYYAALGEAYHSVLAGCHDGEKGASALKPLRQLIVARGVNAVAGEVLTRHFGALPPREVKARVMRAPQTARLRAGEELEVMRARRMLPSGAVERMCRVSGVSVVSQTSARTEATSVTIPSIGSLTS